MACGYGAARPASGTISGVRRSIRPRSAADLARLLGAAPDPRDARRHLDRFGMQEAGQATYLLAWRGHELAGRCTVLAASKYDKVRQLLGACPEMKRPGGTPARSGHRNGDHRLRRADSPDARSSNDRPGVGSLPVRGCARGR